MLSIFLILIATAIVIALALIAFCYGADIAGTASSATAATGLVVQATQISAAIITAQSEGVAVTSGGAPRLGPRYLQKLPVPPLFAYSGGHATADDWAYVEAPEKALGLRSRISTETCMAINRKQGFIGILSAYQPDRSTQCYGEAEPFTFYFRPGTFSSTLSSERVAPMSMSGVSVLCPSGERIAGIQCETAVAPAPKTLREAIEHSYRLWASLVRKAVA